MEPIPMSYPLRRAISLHAFSTTARCTGGIYSSTMSRAMTMIGRPMIANTILESIFVQLLFLILAQCDFAVSDSIYIQGTKLTKNGRIFHFSIHLFQAFLYYGMYPALHLTKLEFHLLSRIYLFLEKIFNFVLLNVFYYTLECFDHEKNNISIFNGGVVALMQ